MRYKSEISWIFGIVIWSIVLFMVYCITLSLINGGFEQWLSIILVLVVFIILWQWFGTYYEVKDNELHYHRGLLNGFILINEIRSISIGKTQFWGLKVGSGIKGCIIKYNKNKGIYISPKNKGDFVAELLKINPDIKVIVNK